MLCGSPHAPPPPRLMTALPTSRRAMLTPLALLVLGTLGFAALWVLLALALQRQSGWMAVLGALDIAWMLRLGRWPAGPLRMAVAVAATAAIVALANWWIIASQLARVLGLSAWDSASRLGWNHAWTLAQLANSFHDVLWTLAAFVVAAVLAR